MRKGGGGIKTAKEVVVLAGAVFFVRTWASLGVIINTVYAYCASVMFSQGSCDFVTLSVSVRGSRGRDNEGW